MKRFLQTFNLLRMAKGQKQTLSWMMFGLLLLGSPVAKGAALSGTYTICPASAGTCNYTTISAAVSALNSNGVSGATTFNIYGGNYSEAVTINSITGASATNTITFNGNGSAAGSTGSNGTGVTRMYNSSTIWYLSNTKYLTLQNMIIEQTSSSYTIYNYYTQYCNITNCLLRYPIGSCCSYNVYDYYSYKTTWTNNIFRGGYMIVYGYCTPNSTSYGYATFKNNRLTQAYYYYAYLYYYNMSVFDGNYIDSAYGTGYSCFDLYGTGNTWKNNKVGNSNMQYGLILEYPNYYSTSSPYTVVNNMMWGQQSYGLYLYIYYATNCNVHAQHNTCSMSGGSYPLYCYGYSSSGWEITNNNFTNTSNPAAYLYADNSCKVDGNNYYTTGGTLLYYGSGTGYADLASYKKAAAVNGHGTYDQSVVSYYKSATDLHLDQTKGAPYGRSVGVLVDIDGDTRCTVFPTSGADEDFFGKGAFKAKISGSSTVYAGTPTVFYNNAKLGEPKVHAWYLDKISTGSKISDSITLLTTALTVGTHKIYLVSQGCAGTSTDSFTVTVVNPTKAPIVDFISDKNLIRQGDVVKFTDLSTNGPNKWAWKITPDSILYGGVKVATCKYLYGTNLTTFRLVAQFNYGGKYKVCLTTSNAAGTGTTNCKVAYIEVTPSINIGSVATISDPKGNLYDDGGPTGNYSYTGGSYRKTVIDPCADSVYLVFNYFNTWCGYDFLRVYEGTSTKGRALHLPCTTTIGYNVGYTGGAVSTFCYGSLPGCQPNTIQNYTAGGTIDTLKAKKTMYLEFEGEYAYNAPGFEAYWWSKPRTEPKPKAKFTSVDTVCTNGVVAFTNATTGSDLSFLWDLDGDPSYYEYNGLNTSWPYFFPGKVNVTLIASNCGGADTFVKTIVVLDPPAPKATFSADNTTPTTNDVAYLSTKGIKACVDAYSWKITKKYAYKTGTTPTVVYVNGTSSSSPNPAVNLPDTGCWDVSLTVTNVSGSSTTFTSCYFNVKGSYCVPTVSTIIPDIGISKVTFNTISNSSSQGVTDYQNFTPTVSTTVEIGVTYKLTVERTTNKNTVTRSAYFDWNGDGDFNDASEFTANDSGSSALVWSTNVTIPSFATKGATVMRIAINQGNYTNKPCGQNEFGEYEDYRIYITPDQTPPVIKIKTKAGKLVDADTVYVEQGLHYGDLGAQAIDNLDGDISTKVTTTQSPKFNKLIPGTYKFIYNVKDAAGNAAISKTRVVIVTPDKTPPTLYVALPETTTVEVGNPVKIPVVIAAEDSLDGDVSGTVVINNPVVAGVIGMYKVTYSDSDASGNKIVVYRYINIIDSIAPVLSLNGKDTVYVEVGTSYTDGGATPTDNYNNLSDLSKKMVVASNINTSKIGTYSITYITSDQSGNKSNTVKRTVIVFDTIKPVISLKGNVKVDWDVFNPWVEPGADFSDNYYTLSGYTTSGTFYNTFSNGIPTKLGTYTIIYKVVDGSGNADSVVRTINVLDRIAPVITMKGTPSVSVCRWALYTDAGYDLKDNYWTNADITITKEGSFASFNTLLDGLYSFRYKAVDKSGNIGYSDYRYVLVQPANSANCVSGIDPTELAKQISVYPNPNTGKFIIKASMSTNEKVRISVSNMYGQEIAVVNNGILNNNQFEVDLSTQAAGMYTVSIMMNNTVVTKQVMVTR